MMRILLFISISALYPNIIEGLHSGSCPSPTVRKRTIIRSKESIGNGAKLIQKTTVELARDCYDLCCDYRGDGCNVALMRYKKDPLNEELVQKFCYLFACGSPSVCTFDSNNRYAVIEIPSENVDSSYSEGGEEQSTEKCPPGVPVPMCSDDPCTTHTCVANPEASCKPYLCGGCYAKFYDENGVQVNCTVQDDKLRASTVTADKHNEQAVTVGDGDYEETPTEHLSPDQTKGKKDDDDDDDKDPYFNEGRRHYLTDAAEKDITFETTKPAKTTRSLKTTPEAKVVIVDGKQPGSTLMSVPLLVALIICIILLIGLIYRFKCARTGKPKKFPVDDGDYLINGMYL